MSNLEAAAKAQLGWERMQRLLVRASGRFPVLEHSIEDLCVQLFTSSKHSPLITIIVAVVIMGYLLRFLSTAYVSAIGNPKSWCSVFTTVFMGAVVTTIIVLFNVSIHATSPDGSTSIVL